LLSVEWHTRDRLGAGDEQRRERLGNGEDERRGSGQHEQKTPVEGGEAAKLAQGSAEQQLVASVIGLNPAIRDRVKSGHREWPKT